VENNGLIQSPQGAIVLAAGKEVELVDAASPFVTVKVAAAEQAVNVGTLVADGGQIGMFGALVRNSGVVEAGRAVAGPGGEIRLVAAKDLNLEAGSVVAANGASGGKVLLQAEGGTNLVGGTVEARGNSGRGGEVSALGVRVGVVGHGVIDASGDSGGGTVLVGGDYQGANPGVQNAERTYIGADGVIRADAMTTGDGGRVVVWADGDTRFFGSISAHGGSEGGNGGFVETSGKGALEAFGLVNVGAPKGQGGIWLLDPATININPGNPQDFGGIEVDAQLLFGDATGEPTVVGAGSIEAAFAYGNSTVLLQATSDINFNGNLSIANTGNLTLQAGNDIRFNLYSLSLNGNLDLQAAASGGTPVTGAITAVPGGGNITTNGGSFNATGNSVSLGNINTVGGANGGGIVTLTATVADVSAGSITTGGGSASLNAWAGGVTVNGAINTSNVLGEAGFGTSNGIVDVVADGNITTGSITTAGLHPLHLGGGNVSLQTNNGVIAVNGSIDARGANGFDNGFDSRYYGGTSGGNVVLDRGALDSFTGLAVRVSGDILTAGGSALNRPSSGIAINHSGGSGGNVTIGNLVFECGAPGCDPVTGGVAVAGAINTRGGDGGSTDNTQANTRGGDAGDISIWASDAVGVGSIVATGGNAGSGADGIYGNAGGWGGGVSLVMAGMLTTGSVNTSGGAGGNAGGSVYGTSAIGGWGGDAGGINISGSAGVNITSIFARGAAGGAGGSAGGYTYAYGGDGGDGSSVFVSSSAGVSIGSVDISGAQGGAGGVATDYAWAGDGGNGGNLSVGGGNVGIGSITGRGADGGRGGTGSNAGGGSGGFGATIFVSASGAVVTGNVDVAGARGGNGGSGIVDASAGDGDNGGSVTLYGGSIAAGAIFAKGGDGGTGGTISDGNGSASGGSGGSGGTVRLDTSQSQEQGLVQQELVLVQEQFLVRGPISFSFTGGPITTGVINVSGGNGGNSGAIGSSFTGGGSGGDGGDATLVGSTINVAGPILSKGGNGGNVINASLPPSQTAGTPTGGAGGSGGVVWVYGLDKVQVNVGGTLGALAIDTSGGAGGSGNPATSPAGNGGAGGGGGSANVVGTPDMTLFGSINASGGAGGAGGAGTASIAGGAGGNGGIGGSIFLDASSITESNAGDGIIFVLAGTQFNVQGGLGGSGGANGGLPGTSGSSNTFIQGSDYFGSIVILDPLSIPEINQAVQQIADDAATAFVGGEKQDEEEDKSQKELASCKG
jgi:hypothetical protein